MTLDKLKVAARQHEQREEWQQAIELYRQAARDGEGGGEGGDPSVHNRIGDLEHRLGNSRAACASWELAATHYGEHGLTNNAIALCNKILRLEPSRVRTYLDLATFHARKRMLVEVRANLSAYRDRMHTMGQADACSTALEALGATFAGWRELRKVVDELLGRTGGDGDDAVSGNAGVEGAHGLIFIDTGPVEFERASESPTGAGPMRVEPTILGGLELEARPGEQALPGLEPTSALGAESDAAPSEVPGLVDVERTAAAVGRTVLLDGLDGTAIEGSQSPATTIRLEGLEAIEFTPPPPSLASDAAPPAPADPDDPLGQRVTANALFEFGDRAAGIAALERALRLYTERDEGLHAWQVAGELIQAEPQAIARYQVRVEVAARLRDTARLCESYQELGDALVREGSGEKAIAVYRRLLELDEGHAGARAALRAMLPEGSEASVPEGFVDLGAMLIDDAGPRSTRMRTETTAISADEDETFREALTEFKRALDQHVAVEDHQAHYDLGIAFKEMGLLEEAIGEFQKAMRSPEGRLRTAEALGATFLEKGMPPVAEAVLRSVERGPEDDTEKIGVLYWLGRALETQGKGDAARGYYERVLAVDVGFMDAVARIGGLASAEPTA